MTPPVRVAIANDYELVVAGLAAALTPYSDRVEIVELDSGVSPQAPVDVVLYDSFGQPQGDQVDLERFSNHGGRLVIFSWNIDADLVQRTVDLGVAGYVSKTAPAEKLVDAIERVSRGETIITIVNGDDDFGRWPGQEFNISNREAEVLALITQGFSNAEICEQTYLSKNTLKTYIRNLYRKIGVKRRAQAVLWGVENGFQPDRVRRRVGD